MLKYVFRRLLLIPIMLIFSTFIIYFLVNLSPADPAVIILGADATEESLEDLREELGVNKPFMVRYFDFIGNAIKGDFGKSYFTGRSVTYEVMARIPHTLKLTLGGVALAMILGTMLGIICAVYQYSFVDNIISTLSIFAAAMPGFWLSLLLLLLFSQGLGWFPSSGVDQGLRSFILPVFTLSVPYIGQYVRYTRSSMLDTIRQDYITTARSKGNTERAIVFRHALKNALLPLVTITGLFVANLMSSAVVIESVFAIPGVGLLVLDSIRKKDIPMVLGSIVFLATFFLLITIIMDILYAYIDPRIKATYISTRTKKASRVKN